MLRRATLSPSDFAAAMEVGAYFQTLRSAYIQQLQAANAPGAVFNQSTLAAQQTAIGTGVQAMLRTRLSAAGMASLDAFIRNEKRNMTVFPMPEMSGAK